MVTTSHLCLLCHTYWKSSFHMSTTCGISETYLPKLYKAHSWHLVFTCTICFAVPFSVLVINSISLLHNSLCNVAMINWCTGSSNFLHQMLCLWLGGYYYFKTFHSQHSLYSETPILWTLIKWNQASADLRSFRALALSFTCMHVHYSFQCSVNIWLEYLHVTSHMQWNFSETSLNCGLLTLTVLVVTIDAQWEGMRDVGSARYEPALLPPCPTIRVLSYSN